MPDSKLSQSLGSLGGDASSASCINNMRLFGLPYQFINSVDPRYPSISSSIGRSYIDHILMQAPTAYIIPGKPVFLPGLNGEAKQGVSHAFLEAANGNINVLKSVLSNNPEEKLRFYDFEEDYCGYMKFVNIMCRTAATFLELPQTINVSGKEVSFQQYDWKNYRWDRDCYTYQAGNQARYLVGTTISNIGGVFKKVASAFSKKSVTGNTAYDTTMNTDDGQSKAWSTNFLQFYVDPSTGASRSLSNSSGASSIKSTLDTASQQMREFQFIANSAGVDISGAEELADSGIGALDEIASNTGAIGNILSRILSVGSSVVKGDNVILPEVYQGSDYGIDHTIDIHLRSPYGNKFAIYMDIIVPMLHLIALVAPRQTSSNSFGSPFLVKVYYPGSFNCNLGIVESIQITTPSSEDAWNTDRLPTEIDIQLRIKDMYSDLTLSPSNDTTLFANNASLIDYLATISGLSLVEPQLSSKFNMSVNNIVTSLTDIPANVGSEVSDFFERKFKPYLTL